MRDGHEGLDALVRRAAVAVALRRVRASDIVHRLVRGQLERQLAVLALALPHQADALRLPEHVADQERVGRGRPVERVQHGERFALLHAHARGAEEVPLLGLALDLSRRWRVEEAYDYANF